MAIRQPRMDDVPERSPYHGKRMSEAEYLALPDQKPELEYWDGLVSERAIGDLDHGRLQVLFSFFLWQHEREHGGWTALSCTTRFPGHGYLAPDASYWAPGKPSGSGRSALPPTLAVEVRSPDETLESQRRKCRQMRANGVDVCWLIDPVGRGAERFEEDADGVPVPADGALESPLLPGLSIPLGDLWIEMDRRVG